MEHLTEKEASDFFAEFYGGDHHIPGQVKQAGYGFSVNHNRGDIATFDFNQMTRLVLMGHDKCIRVSVEAIRNGVMKISIWKRQREGSMYERHPTIEQAIEKFRAQ
jgi:hypothetical protein